MRRIPPSRPASPFLRLALAAALASLLVPGLALAQANGKLQIHHVDIGQGDGMLLISPLGQRAFFDDGTYTDCTGIVGYCQSLGITSVDYHFLSHYHADHLGCIDDLAAAGVTVAIAGYDRGYSYSSASYTAYVNTLGAKRVTMTKGQTITLDAGAAYPVVIKCVDLNGAGVYSPSGSDENAKSMVMLVTYGNFNEVIGGDLTGSVANGNDVETTVGPEVGDVEVYKVHHHGSTYSSNDNWLNAVTPEVGIIQVGDGNSYGHPTAGALGRLHAHGVHTYWNETGAGVAPDPNWDKVGGTIVVQADPGAGAAYTVSGSGFTDTYYNDGGAPPINTTEFASAVTVLKGSIATGDYTRLAVSDDSRIGISAGVSSGKYYTDWYGSVVLQHPPLDLSLSYEGSFTVSRTQTLYLWNWSTGVWDQMDSFTVGTTDVSRTFSASVGSYVSATREVRFRVKGNNRSQGSYTSRGDYMAFAYDYTAGTAPMMAAVHHTEHEAVVGGGAGGAREYDAAIASSAAAPVLDREAFANRPPQSVLRHIEAASSVDGARLTWAVAAGDHVDGFNVYREDGPDGLRFAGNEAGIEVANGEAVFTFVDAARADQAATYWLGTRSCSGSEALVGPIRVEAAAPAASLALAASPNPAARATRFEFALPRAADVRLEVFDLQGRRIATPMMGRAAAGPVTVDWAVRDDAGRAVEPGLYFARLQTLGRTLYTRVTVIGN
jgi:beta-lactamase superfamily II metal-dependent hydrolase